MVRTRKASRKHNNNASSKKRIKTCGNGGRAPWSDLNTDVLYSVMTRLGVVDFISFGGVCKSWRSLALSNRKSFMASRPPMLMSVSGPYTKTCHLQDFEGRLFKTIIPHSMGRTCVGLTSGYLILFGEETRDFWLVNPITRYELHFPDVPFHVDHPHDNNIRGILVFSRSINAWVFVVVNRFKHKVWFSIANKGTWNNVSTGTTDLVFDVHAFKGKIYTLNLASPPESRHVCEMTLGPVPKLTELDTRFLEPVATVFEFTSSDENLYVMDYTLDTYKVHRVGFDEPSCVPCDKTKQEYVLFNSHMKFNFVLRPESWAAPSPLSRRFFENKKRREDRLYMAEMWYFPHDCLDVTIIEK